MELTDNIYKGLESEIRIGLPEGSLYIASDTKKLFIYDGGGRYSEFTVEVPEIPETPQTFSSGVLYGYIDTINVSLFGLGGTQPMTVPSLTETDNTILDFAAPRTITCKRDGVIEIDMSVYTGSVGTHNFFIQKTSGTPGPVRGTTRTFSIEEADTFVFRWVIDVNADDSYQVYITPGTDITFTSATAGGSSPSRPAVELSVKYLT